MTLWRVNNYEAESGLLATHKLATQPRNPKVIQTRFSYSDMQIRSLSRSV